MFCPAIYCFVLLTGSFVYGKTTNTPSLSPTEPNTSLHSFLSSRTASTSATPSASVITSQYSVSTYSDSTTVSPTKPSIATSTNSSSANATINTTVIPTDSSTADVNSSSTLNDTSSKPTSLPLTSITVSPASKPTASSTTASVGSGTGTKPGRTCSTQIPALSSRATMSTTVLPKTTSGKAKIDVAEPKALSAASVVAIVLVVIAIVIVVFGGAYYLKMRRSSYGRLLEDSEYSTVGNFQNPLYEH